MGEPQAERGRLAQDLEPGGRAAPVDEEQQFGARGPYCDGFCAARKLATGRILVRPPPRDLITRQVHDPRGVRARDGPGEGRSMVPIDPASNRLVLYERPKPKLS